MFSDSFEGKTHFACWPRMQAEGAQARCCGCEPHPDCVHAKDASEAISTKS